MRWERACTPERLATEKLPNRWPRPTGVALGGVGGDELTVLRRISRRSTLAVGQGEQTWPLVPITRCRVDW
jgi:hypothetical protein